MIVRSFTARPANDNLGAVSFTERTLMGFAAVLTATIIAFALLIIGGAA